MLGTLCVTVIFIGTSCKSTQTSGSSASPSASASASATASPTLRLSTAPTATVVSGDTATIALDVSGIKIVAPDSDTSGKTGHFHVFIDKDPVPAGTLIPHAPGIVHTAATTTAIPATLLKTGNNTIWVELGYADHTPFNPEIVDKVVVAVTPAPAAVTTTATP